MTDAGKRELLEKTIARLSQMEYTLKPVDHEFLKKYGTDIYRLNIKI